MTLLVALFGDYRGEHVDDLLLTAGCLVESPVPPRPAGGAAAGLGVVPDAPPPAYDVDARIPALALALAARLEDGLSVRWRDLVVGTDDRSLRELGTAGLQETAVRAAQWRLLAGDLQVTRALPGVA